MRKKIWLYGLISGAVMLLLFFGMMPVWKDNHNYSLAEILGYSTMVIALSSIFFAVKNHRDRDLGGTIGFQRAFLIGIYITLVASALYVAGWLFYIYVIDTSFMENFYQHYVEGLRSSDRPSAEIDSEIARMEQYKELYRNPFLQIAITFLEVFPVGLIISLLSALLLKRTTPTAAPTEA